MTTVANYNWYGWLPQQHNLKLDVFGVKNEIIASPHDVA